MTVKVQLGRRWLPYQLPRKCSERAVAEPQFDPWLLWTAVTLAALGLVMVTSASISTADKQYADPFHFVWRQAGFLALGTLIAAGVVRVPLALWQRLSLPMLALGFALLVLVLIPALGRQVNGSARWLAFGPINIQVSELVKLFAVVFIAGFLARRLEEVRTSASGFLKPMAVLASFAVLLLLEPDFGAIVVILVTALVMMFLAGARLGPFVVIVAALGALLAALAILSPYRLQRLVSFTDPWADPFNSGFQLSQALIAFGRGEWLGVGLGGSIQKLFYLPEAHTDFVYAVLAEELGVVGALAVVAMFAVVAWRALAIGRAAEHAGQAFAAFLAYGIGAWLVFQAFVNMGVNMGLLPTKGLTLPLMSYGGSSMVVTCIAIALLLRVAIESRSRASLVRRAT